MNEYFCTGTVINQHLDNIYYSAHLTLGEGKPSPAEIDQMCNVLSREIAKKLKKRLECDDDSET